MNETNEHHLIHHVPRARHAFDVKMHDGATIHVRQHGIPGAPRLVLSHGNGLAIDGPVELRKQLANRPDVFADAVTEKLMMYAINRPLEYFDMPQVRKVVRDAKKDDYTLASLVSGIVNTDAFRKQGPEAVSKAAPKPNAVTTAEVKK